jgi:hypothetical protein
MSCCFGRLIFIVSYPSSLYSYVSLAFLLSLRRLFRASSCSFIKPVYLYRSKTYILCIFNGISCFTFRRDGDRPHLLAPE